jgi:predicted NodU family carbamoyl transferase
MITIGLNYSQMHDSSACIVRDGELLFAVSDERIGRLSRDLGQESFLKRSPTSKSICLFSMPLSVTKST